MKLKKIASLMLAGVMAVSMLTACGSDKDSGSTNEPEVVPAAGVVSAIQDAVKVWNSDLKITVQESDKMNAELENYFKDAQDKFTEAGIVDAFNSVFDANNTPDGIRVNTDNILTSGVGDFTSATYRDVNDEYYGYAIIPVEKVSGASVETFAANMIGNALQDLSNRFKTDDDIVLEGSYTLYVSRVDAQKADNSKVPYVLAVLGATYEEVL